MPLWAILIGLGAGLASAVLFASASTGTLFGLLVLFLLSPLPVMMAGLGWGWASAAVGAGASAAAISVIGNGRAALFYTLAIGLPAALFAYLALLSRPERDPITGAARLEWYPLGRIVAWAVGWAAVLTTFALLATGPDVDGLRAALGAAFDKMQVIRGVDTAPGTGNTSPTAPGEGVTAVDTKMFVEIMVIWFPWAVATCWLTMAMLNAWAAGHCIRLSGRLARPWPDLASLQLPRQTPIAFAAAVASSFLPGMAGLMASGAASAIVFAYVLVGLAILHAVTRGRSIRPMLLTLVYGALLLLSPFSALAVAMIGLAEPISPLRRMQPSGPTPPATPSGPSPPSP